MMINTTTSTVTTGRAHRYDADGTEWIQVVAHGSLTAKTPYMIFPGQTGMVSAAVTGTAAQYGYLGIPAVGITSGDTAWLQVGGRCDSMVTPSLSITAGHAMTMHNGAVADSGAAWAGAPAAFAVCTKTTTTDTATDVYLVGEKILTTT